MLDRTAKLKTYQTYIDGRWIDAASGKTFQTCDPYTGQSWALIPECDKVDVDQAVEAASRAFERGPWPRMTPSARGKVMRRIAQLIEQHAEHLGQVEVRDNGKLISEMVAQTKYMPEWFYYYGGLADKIQGTVVAVDRPDHFNYILREPVGVCAFITPWNSPPTGNKTVVPGEWRRAEHGPLPETPSQAAPCITLRFCPLHGRLAQRASGLRYNEGCSRNGLGQNRRSKNSR